MPITKVYLYTKTSEIELAFLNICIDLKLPMMGIADLNELKSLDPDAGHVLIIDTQELNQRQLSQIEKSTKNCPQMRTIAVISNPSAQSSSQASAFHFDDLIFGISHPTEIKFRVSRQLNYLQEIDRVQVINFLDYQIDLARRIVKQDKSVIKLSRKEFDLLQVLVSSPNRVFSRTELVSRLWERSNIESHRTVDTHITTLKRKLKLSSIACVRGVGYVLRNNSSYDSSQKQDQEQEQSIA